jgi:hypothetical protein
VDAVVVQNNVSLLILGDVGYYLVHEFKEFHSSLLGGNSGANDAPMQQTN